MFFQYLSSLIEFSIRYIEFSILVRGWVKGWGNVVAIFRDNEHTENTFIVYHYGF